MNAMIDAKERPILFSGPMIRALWANLKTQTRRVVKPQPPSIAAVRAMAGDGYGWLPPEGRVDYWRVVGPVWAVRECWKKPDGYPPNVNSCVSLRCPYGQVGDRLWVRESFIYLDQYDEDGNELPRKIWYRADQQDFEWLDDDGYSMTDPPWKPSIHMPRSACRMVLELTAIRLEPLQAINCEDAKAEGFCDVVGMTARAQFAELWDLLNGKTYPWQSDPHVWALTFKRVHAAAGQPPKLHPSTPK